MKQGLIFGITVMSALFAAAGLVVSDVPASATPDSVTAPVHIVPEHVGYTPTVKIKVAGSEPLTVLLDSGSSGLVINRPDLPASIRNTLTDLHATISQNYTSGDVVGDLYQGDFSLLGDADATLATWSNVTLLVGECTPPGPSCGWPRAGIQGVLGIANGAQEWTATSPASGSGVFAPPFTYGPLPLGSGVSFHFDSQTQRGSFTVGAPAVIANGTTMQAPAKGLTYDNGLPVFWHYVAGCWVISTITSCDAYTTFDSGAEHGFISTYQFIPLLGATPRDLPTGTVIDFSGGPGQSTFGSLTVSDPLFSLKYNPGQRNNPLASNSGSGFLLDRDVAIDYAHGTVTISGDAQTLSNTGVSAVPIVTAAGLLLLLGILALFRRKLPLGW